MKNMKLSTRLTIGFGIVLAILLDTFETMLDLMDEYKDFTFLQSQASVYDIVEQHAPEMLTKIKQRVKEGRWEVLASTWVEADKNIPNGESMVRHLLYTRDYLSNLLDIDPTTLDVDFEPDTFGHSINVPEILQKGGVNYYYHCRGFDKYALYRWQAPSGSAVTVFREPTWYNANIPEHSSLHALDFCKETNMDTFLWVYGVGDHGGGPTRRDLTRIIEMNNWPVFPNYKFGTIREFYKLTDKIKDDLPIVKDELNFIFTGCYTTQTRIKMGNRLSEDMLNQAESYNAFSKDIGYSYDNNAFAKAWKKVLFNQFHDIIPGSGVIQTREHAMGMYQEAMAIANTKRSMAMKAIAKNIDTSSLFVDEDISLTRSEGAGVGAGIDRYDVSHVERGAGKRRVFHIFNPSSYERDDLTEITVWDWVTEADPQALILGDLRGIADKYFMEAAQKAVFFDVDGNPIPFQILNSGINNYWAHTYLKVLVKVKVPALGYTTLYLDEKETDSIPYAKWNDPRVDTWNKPILENDMIRLEFNPNTAEIISLIDRTNNSEMVLEGKSTGTFRFIHEDTIQGMTSWRVGRYMNIENLHNNDVKITGIVAGSHNLKQHIEYTIEFERSKLDVKVYIEKGSPMVKFDVKCHFLEVGTKDTYIPQLNFHVPLNYSSSKAIYDIPMGIITREAMDMDVPAQSFCTAFNENGKSMFVGASCKYGFRYYNDSIGVTLIRGSYDPDPEPELFTHYFTLAIAPIDNSDTALPYKLSDSIRQRMSPLAVKAGKGTLNMTSSFMELVEGDVIISGIKKAENSDEIIIRGYSLSDNSQTITIKFDKDITSVRCVDIMENDIDGGFVEIIGNEIKVKVGMNEVFGIAIG